MIKEKYLDGATLEEINVPDSVVRLYAKQTGKPARVCVGEYIELMRQQREEDEQITQAALKEAMAKAVEYALNQSPAHLVMRDGDSVYFSYGGVTYRIDVSTARR